MLHRLNDCDYDEPDIALNGFKEIETQENSRKIIALNGNQIHNNKKKNRQS